MTLDPLHDFPVTVQAETVWGRISGTLSYDTSRGFGFVLNGFNDSRLPETLSVLDVRTSNGHFVRVFDLKAYGWALERPYKFSVDACLISPFSFPDEGAWVEEWALPCDAILDYTPLRPVHFVWAKTERQVHLSRHVVCEFSVPSWETRGVVQVSYEGPTSSESVSIDARANIRFNYDRPIGLNSVLDQETSLREVLDLLWHRRHASFRIWLRSGSRTFEYYRSSGVSVSGSRPSSHLRFKDEDLWPSLGGILDQWQRSVGEERRAVHYLLRTVRNSIGLPIDLRFWMMMQAVEVWHRATTQIQGASNLQRLKYYMKYWRYKTMPDGVSLDAWLERMRDTRHDITHLSREHDKVLQGVERTVAMNDLFIVFRACLLEHFGFGEEQAEEYARGAFERAAHTQFVYHE